LVIKGNIAWWIGPRCKPKECGSLGILNTRFMNIVLMLKWVWKLYQNAQGLWQTSCVLNILEVGTSSLRKCMYGASSFGMRSKILNGISNLGLSMVLNGRHTFFWIDRWQGSGPLRVRSPYCLGVVPTHSYQCWNREGKWWIHFIRQIDLAERVEWDNLCREVQALPSTTVEDTVS
jgi:hypothetical protein